MVVPSARGSPALVLSATPLAIAATSFIFDSGTIIRDGALQDWPELLNMCITPPVTALVEVGAFEDDVRRLAAEFLADALDGRRGALGDIDAGAGRAGERDHVDVRVLAHRGADLGAEAVDAG